MNDAKIWRYHLLNQNGQGWGIIILDSCGFFAAITDWGSYTYLWGRGGWADPGRPGGNDFRRWFLTLDDGYLADKLSLELRQWGYVINREKTAKAFRRATLETRRNRGFTKTQARVEWERIQNFENDNDCEHELVRTSELSEAWELPVRKEFETTHGFFKDLMPRLRATIKAELEQEKP